MPSIVAPMKTRLPAVVIPPPRLGAPVTGMPLATSSGYSPSGIRQAMSPVLALTAINSPHGGCAQLYLLAASQKRPPSGVTLLMFGPVPGAVTFSGRSGGSPPARAPRPLGSPPRPPRPPRPAPGARSSRCPHCPVLWTLVIIKPSDLLTMTPCQLPPPTAPGKTTMSCFSCHGLYGTESDRLYFSQRPLQCASSSGVT